MSAHTYTSQHTQPVLWITGSTNPGPHEKRICVELVTQLAQDGWAISTDASGPIESLAQRSARAIGGKLVSPTAIHLTSDLAGPGAPHVALPRRLWDARTAGLCEVGVVMVGGRLIVRVDLARATTSSDDPDRTVMRRPIFGVER
jgi:hypothetical protein